MFNCSWKNCDLSFEYRKPFNLIAFSGYTDNKKTATEVASDDRSHCWRGIRVGILTFLRADTDEVQRLIRDFEALQSL